MLQLLKRNIVKIVFIITVIIVTFVILMILYAEYFEPEKEIETPRGSMYFNEDPYNPGKYYGDCSCSANNKDIKIELYDLSLDARVTMDKPINRASVQVPGGCSLTYLDNNANKKQDGCDTLIIEDGETGDKVTVIYKPTGESIAIATLP